MTTRTDQPRAGAQPWWVAGGLGLLAFFLLMWLVQSTLIKVVVLPLLVAGLRAGFVHWRRSRNHHVS